MTFNRFHAATLIAFSLASGASQAAAFTFSFALPGNGSDYTFASQMNDSRQIIGGTYLAPAYHTENAALVSNGTLRNLTAPPAWSGSSYGYGINNTGISVGQMQVNNARNWGAVKWDSDGNRTMLAPLVSGTDASAYAINNNGTVVGSAVSSSGAVHAVKWVGTQAVDLGALSAKGFNASRANSINDAGVTVGYVTNASYQSRAVQWTGNTLSELAMLAGDTQSSAAAINSAGTIVGYGLGADGKSHAEIWSGGRVALLGSVGTSATDINDYGVAVGSSYVNYQFTALMWVNGREVKLDQYLTPALKNAGWKLTSAVSINNNGDIVGRAENSRLGQSRMYVLAAVPEPETYAMLLAGFAALGFAARRRKGV